MSIQNEPSRKAVRVASIVPTSFVPCFAYFSLFDLGFNNLGTDIDGINLLITFNLNKF